MLGDKPYTWNLKIKLRGVNSKVGQSFNFSYMAPYFVVVDSSNQPIGSFLLEGSVSVFPCL